MADERPAAVTPIAPRHHLAEDIHALVTGASFCAFGLILLKAAGLITGGVAGLALMVAYLTRWPVGLLFVLLSAPFFLLAQRRMGWAFTLKSVLTLGLLAGFTSVIPAPERSRHSTFGRLNWRRNAGLRTFECEKLSPVTLPRAILPPSLGASSKSVCSMQRVTI